MEYPAPGRARVEVADEETLRSLQYCGGWLTREEALRQIAQPASWVVVAHEEGRLLGYAWGEQWSADLSFFDLEIPLPPDTVYAAHYFVDPEARGRGLARAIQCELLAEARCRGAGRVILCVDARNDPMNKLQKQLGMRAYMHAHYLRLSGWRWYRMEPAGGGKPVTTGDMAEAAEVILHLGSEFAGGGVGG